MSKLQKINLDNLFTIINKVTFGGEIESILLKITKDKIESKMSQNEIYSIIKIKNDLILDTGVDEICFCFLNHKITSKYFEFIKNNNPDKEVFDLQILEDRIVVLDKNKTKTSKIEIFISDESVVEDQILTTYNEKMFKPIYEETYSKFIKNWLIPLKAAPGKFVYFTCKNKELFISIEDEEILSNKIEMKIENLDSKDFRFKFNKSIFKILNIIKESDEFKIKLNHIISDDLVENDFGVVVFEKRMKETDEIYGLISSV